MPQGHPHPSDWQTLGEALAAYPDAWTVLDGYNFDPAYQKQVKDADHRLMVIDDIAHLDRYYADVVLNQNIYATELQYACELQSRLLLGRSTFCCGSESGPGEAGSGRCLKLARKILVTLGGSDPDNKTREVMRALSEIDIDGIEVIFVAGASNPHTEELQSAAVSMPYANDACSKTPPTCLN